MVSSNAIEEEEPGQVEELKETRETATCSQLAGGKKRIDKSNILLQIHYFTCFAFDTKECILLFFCRFD